MNKKSFILSFIACCSLLFSTSCSDNSDSQISDDLAVRYENYVNNGGQLTYDEWLKIIEDPELNNENYDAPYIGSNGNWYVDNLDTGIKASGDDGNSITIVNTSSETDGNVTYTKIEFSDGSVIKIPNGTDGVDAYTPYIQDGYWYINGESTGVAAKGDEVEMRLNDGNIEWKTSSSSEWNILISVDILKGNDGLNGKSAYEIYKQYCNYEGSEEEWINDLVNGLLHFDDPGITESKAAVEKENSASASITFTWNYVNKENLKWAIERTIMHPDSNVETSYIELQIDESTGNKASATFTETMACTTCEDSAHEYSYRLCLVRDDDTLYWTYPADLALCCGVNLSIFTIKHTSSQGIYNKFPLCVSQWPMR